MVSQQYVAAWTAAFTEQMGANALNGVAGALIGIPVIGPLGASVIKAYADELSAQAAANAAAAQAANDGVAATNTQLALTGSSPLHVSGSDSTADASVPYTSCQSSIAVTATQAIIGFVRITRPAQREMISWSADVSGTYSSLIFNVYKLDPATGNLNWVYTSPDQSALLTGAFTVNQFAFPTDTQSVMTNDVYAVEAVMTGSGTVSLWGMIPANTPGKQPTRPYQFGGFRNPTVLGASPAQIPASTMDNNYVGNVPWFTFGSQVNAVATARVISDNYGSGLGNWVLYNNTGSNAYITTVSGRNMFAFYGSNDGYEGGVNITPLLTDNFDCSANFVAPNGMTTEFQMCGNDGMSDKYVALAVSSGSASLRWYTSGGWNGGSYTTVASSSSAPAGLFYVTYRLGVWTVYTGASPDDGGTEIMSWTEPTSGGPQHGPGYRYFGLKLFRNLYQDSSAISSFMAKDV